MSYILDALTRAQSPASPGGKRQAFSGWAHWRLVALGGLLALVVLSGTTYLGARGQDRTPPSQSETRRKDLHAAGLDVPSMAPRPPRQAAPRPPPAAASVAPSVATPAVVRSAPSAARPATSRANPLVALTQPLPVPSPLGPGGAYLSSPPAPASAAGTPAAAPLEPPRHVTRALRPPGDLPPDVRAALAQMKLRVLFYAPQPRSRFVMIDERELREGDEIVTGLRLEEITDSGMVVRNGDMLVLSPATPAK